MSEKYSAIMQLGHHSNVTLVRELSSDMLAVRRVIQEKQARIYQTLKKNEMPHIPTVYDISYMGNGQYEVLEEYIDGHTLEEILQEEGKIAEQFAVSYITQLCETLEQLHLEGVVHRDVKPGNIVVTKNGFLYLIDFDIARIRKPEENLDTEILGTQGYAAPEQFGFCQTDAQADIYSVGVLLNKLLTGKMPNECFAKGSIAYVVRRCLQMDASRRYRSARTLKKALRPYLPQGHPQAFRFLRRIPGFRSFTIWKMAFAGTVYFFGLICIIVIMPEMITAGAEVCFGVTISILYYIFLFFFLFDVFRARSRIRWLERARGKWTYPLKCVLWMLFILIFVSTIYSMLFE